MEYLQFPAWQTICLDAVKESDPHRFPGQVIAAEKAVLSRAQEIENMNHNSAEQAALNGALKSLRHLKRLIEWI